LINSTQVHINFLHQIVLHSLLQVLIQRLLPLLTPKHNLGSQLHVQHRSLLVPIWKYRFQVK